MSKLAAAVFTGLLGGWGLCSAAWAEGITGDVAAGLSYQPHDPSGSRYETRPVPYLDLDWGDVSLSTDDGLTWSALDTHGLTAGPYINYLPGRTSNGELQGLRNVSDMAEVGGFVQYARPISGGSMRNWARPWAAGIPRAAPWVKSAASWVTPWVAGLSAAIAWLRILPMRARPIPSSAWTTTKPSLQACGPITRAGASRM